MKKLLSVIVLLLSASALQADHTTHYRVLIPVHLFDPAPGAFGSIWTTPVAVHNPTTSTIHIDHCVSLIEPGLPCLLYLFASEELQPGETQTELPPISQQIKQTIPARLLWLKTVNGTAPPSSLSFQLRSADISRSATNAGTEVPVVREEQFRTSKLNLLNVPVDNRFRLTLRLYETLQSSADFRVRLFNQESGALIGESTLRLQMPATAPFEPGYAQIGDLMTLVPAGTTLPANLRIEIDPVTEGSQFWAFVSITNNDTQHITLVTPN